MQRRIRCRFFISALAFAGVIFFIFLFSHTVRAGSDLSVSLDARETVLEGEMMNLSVCVENNGEAVQDVQVEVFHGHPARGGALLFNDSISIDGGGMECLLFRWDSLWNPGEHDLYAAVDLQGHVNDPDRDNNMARRTVTVKECYADVLLIVNNNSEVSREIGQY